MEWVERRLRPIASKVSPRHRRWQQLLASLTYDPGAPAQAVMAPSEDDFIICGCSRTGTSLVTAELFRPPRAVTVMEPWDGMRLPPSELYAGLRDEIAEGTLRRGRLDVPELQRHRSVRWCRDGEVPVAVTVDAGFQLGVKWPAFWRYLEHLPDTRFVVCVRDPVETIASFKKTGGRLAEGLNYDIAFHREMNEALTAATDDPAVRRVLLYDYVHSRIIPFLDRSNVFVVRYDRWFDDRESLLGELGAFLGVDIDRGLVEIRPPGAGGSSGLSDRELDLIREHCATAAALGYEV